MPTPFAKSPKNPDLLGGKVVEIQKPLCAYQLPGGAIAMQFGGRVFPMSIPTGAVASSTKEPSNQRY
jgi:hypothetical protein